MIRVIPQTREEKIAMYMKLTKRELAEMLASANEVVEALTREKSWQTTIPATTSTPQYRYVTTTWSPLNNLSRTYQ